jgi:hypothetical protein
MDANRILVSSFTFQKFFKFPCDPVLPESQIQEYRMNMAQMWRKRGKTGRAANSDAMRPEKMIKRRQNQLLSIFK